jgi:hypothetical protein
MAPEIPLRGLTDFSPPPPTNEPVRSLRLSERDFRVLEINTLAEDYGFDTPAGLIGEPFCERCPGPIADLRIKAVRQVTHHRFYMSVLPTTLFGPVRLRRFTFRRQKNGTYLGYFAPVPLSLPDGLPPVAVMAPAITDILIDPFGNPTPIWGQSAEALAYFLKEHFAARLAAACRDSIRTQKTRVFWLSGTKRAALYCLGNHLSLLRVISIPKVNRLLDYHERTQKQRGPLVHSVAR